MRSPVFRRLRLIATVAGSLMMLTGWMAGPASAASAKELDAGTDEAIGKFEQEIKGGKAFLESSKGMLVFPRVLKENMERVPSGLRARRSTITACCRGRSACNLEARSRLSISCSWTRQP